MAFNDWISSPASGLFRKRFDDHKYDIYTQCEQECKNDCNGARGCVLTRERIHELLKD
ncbi:MAG: hypothetical protein ABH824_06860 [Nanoarchaeota archaeon]|nr:hypothetical protein [Nanoarchaeota archaeon]MBU1631684.1 hypothetical protein [Nanoarchaeota archaeon]MBU1876254.1 hypothetical protein [Nanoarchaeota archaeon]